MVNDERRRNKEKLHKEKSGREEREREREGGGGEGERERQREREAFEKEVIRSLHRAFLVSDEDNLVCMLLVSSLAAVAVAWTKGTRLVACCIVLSDTFNSA